MKRKAALLSSRGRLSCSERAPFAVRKTVFCSLKGHLLEPETWPFATYCVSMRYTTRHIPSRSAALQAVRQGHETVTNGTSPSRCKALTEHGKAGSGVPSAMLRQYDNRHGLAPQTAPISPLRPLRQPHNELKRPPYFVFLHKNTIFATGINLNSIKRTTHG